MRTAKELAEIRKKPAFRRLAALFKESGYVRRPDRARLEEGWHKYKKGWEVRLSVSPRELSQVRLLLVAVGLSPGRPYAKTPNVVIQPVYGRDAVALFSKG